MNVIDAATAIGLSVSDTDATGTVDEAKVIDALAGLAADDPDNADLFADAAERVRHARSAGVEAIDPADRSLRPRDAAPIQLRYRNEMVDIFTDLTIDVGIRRSTALVDASG